MSNRTMDKCKKKGTSTFANPSLVSPNTPTLANPTHGFGLSTNNPLIQTATEVLTNLQGRQPVGEQSLELQAIKEKPLGHDISRISLHRPQAKSSLHTTDGSFINIQRDPLRPSSTTTDEQETASRNDPDRDIVEKILTDIARRGGITVAFYAASSVRSAAEFSRQAQQFAEDHRAIGLRGGAVTIGAAMEMNSGVPSLLQSLTQSISDLFTRYPDIAGEISQPITVDTLAIFTHGGTSQLQAGAPNRSDPEKNQWIRNSLGVWVEALVPFLSTSPRVLLYACSVSGQPATGIPFSEALQQALQEGLENQYGSDAGVAPEVWGHETAGHTTANSRVVGFTGEAGSSVEQNLQQLFISRMTARISDEIGGLPTLTGRQQRRFDRAVTLAVRRILRGSTGRLDPLNAYIREIPQMGIERVWQDTSSSSTPNFSDLDLTPDAQERVAAGLAIYQRRFTTQLENLITMVREF